VAGGFAAEVAKIHWPVSGIVAAGIALAVAGLTRYLHPGLLTQTAVLGSITSLATAILVWLEQTLIPPLVVDSGGSVTDTGPDPILLVLGSAVWWLATGLIIGLIETFWSAYFSIEYKDVAAFSMLAIVLIFFPTGLLGRPEVEKV